MLAPLEQVGSSRNKWCLSGHAADSHGSCPRGERADVQDRNGDDTGWATLGPIMLNTGSPEDGILAQFSCVERDSSCDDTFATVTRSLSVCCGSLQTLASGGQAGVVSQVLPVEDETIDRGGC